jgi:PPM family protein phosphatase
VSGELSFDIGADSHVGLRYPANFDVWRTEARLGDPALPYVLVADGMGASEGSATAGRTTMAVLGAGLNAAPTITPNLLRRIVADAQQQVIAAGRRLGELTGCTLSGLVVDGEQGWIVQLGDSRVLRLRNGLLEVLTVDHTSAWLGAIQGWYPHDSPAANAARYQLHRYMGHPAAPEPDLLNVALRAGDTYLVCSDGIAEQVSYQRLLQVLGSDAAPAAMAATLTADALAAGGDDNATAVILRIR